ncbi:hypothetical protein [Cetobacterium sp.]|uniref:hypothetical protein n=1 Tax=Cetobacterium sp. TaxID=2071632 RepID=UPI003F2B033D
MSKEKKVDFREAEVGGFWSTANPNVFNGTVNGKDVLLVRNVNKNGNSKFPEFRLYSKEAYNKLIIEDEILKQKTRRGSEVKDTYKELKSEDIFIIDIKDIEYNGGF